MMAKPNAVSEMLSFQGRVSRMDWWLIGIGLSFLQGLLALGLAAAMGDHSLGRNPGSGTPAQWAQLALATAFLWPITAVSVKRAHDRGGPGFAPILYTMLTLGLLVAQLARPDLFLVSTDPEMADELGTADIAILTVTAVIVLLSLWMLVTLGFLKGTPGRNRYGPSPYANVDYQAPRND